MLGLGSDPINVPVIMNCVLDTGASLTTGNFHYCAYIAKTYPEVVSRVLTSETFAPISLSGVVQNDGNAVTTELPVAFEFHMPYLTREGNPTTLLVACGPHVSVNSILGYPFMSAVGMSIDFIDNVADCKGLDCKPFSIENRKARVHVPSAPVNLVDADNRDAFYSTFISELETLERKILDVYCSVPDNASKRVRINESVDTQSVELSPDEVATLPPYPGSTPPPQGAPLLTNEALRDALHGVTGLTNLGVETHWSATAE